MSVPGKLVESINKAIKHIEKQSLTWEETVLPNITSGVSLKVSTSKQMYRDSPTPLLTVACVDMLVCERDTVFWGRRETLCFGEVEMVSKGQPVKELHLCSSPTNKKWRRW